MRDQEEHDEQYWPDEELADLPPSDADGLAEPVVDPEAEQRSGAARVPRARRAPPRRRSGYRPPSELDRD